MGSLFGGSQDDIGTSMQPTSDGGYIIAGYTISSDGQVTGDHGGGDMWVVKISSTGSLQWQKCFGGSGNEEAFSISCTADGGYIIVGNTNSTDGQVIGSHGGYDGWVVKLDDTGAIQWQRALGGSGDDYINSVIQAADGNYIVVGETSSTDGDVAGNHGVDDYFVAKLGSTGSIIWQKCYGGSSVDDAACILQAVDGGYIVAGNTYSSDGDVSGSSGSGAVWIIKIDDTGAIQWRSLYGGNNYADVRAMQPTGDSGYVIAGSTESDDLPGYHPSGSFTMYTPDYWVCKIKSSGSIQWQKCYGGSNSEIAQTIQQTLDGGYIVAGLATSNDGDVSGLHAGPAGDCWVVRLDTAGDILWQKCLGGSGYDKAAALLQTADSGYVVQSNTASTDGDVAGNHGGMDDLWVVKLYNDRKTAVPVITNFSPITVMPNPTTGPISLSVPVASIRVCNILSQCIKGEKNTNNISISEFPSGIYVSEAHLEAR